MRISSQRCSCRTSRYADNGETDAGMPPQVQAAQLPYFPYAQRGACRESSSSSSLERLVCAICLEQLRHGELCSEVPACRHVFHWDCVGVWIKNSDTCPLCRVKISSWIAGSTEAPPVAHTV
ncbi:hypothetical protein E2562_010287 [Oryza meyeriana var. granulata]|uniref:RING-type E3 ubiquitin transferase n=1 Tax=Oryza meyeriana var. granulata TaxID=110450 RepID=A0A6G1EHZ8_9ORYZ|nr:hypothetical protein E2562_010287 [Oryza meyeriana var. granulata]